MTQLGTEGATGAVNWSLLEGLLRSVSTGLSHIPVAGCYEVFATITTDACKLVVNVRTDFGGSARRDNYTEANPPPHMGDGIDW